MNTEQISCDDCDSVINVKVDKHTGSMICDDCFELEQDRAREYEALNPTENYFVRMARIGGKPR